MHLPLSKKWTYVYGCWRIRIGLVSQLAIFGEGHQSYSSFLLRTSIEPLIDDNYFYISYALKR